MIESIKKVLRPIYVPIANWHYRNYSGPQRYHHLYDSVKAIPAAKILEVGVWNGKRAVRMIETAKQAGISDVHYYGYDLFEALGEEGYQAELSKRPPTEAEVRELLEATGATVELFTGNTLETLPQSVPNLPTMDFIFIDGGHSNETVLSDWEQIRPLIGPDTIVIFDDYWHNRTDGGAKLTVDAIDTNEYDVTILPEIDRFDNPDFGYLEISFAKVTKRQSGE